MAARRSSRRDGQGGVSIRHMRSSDLDALVELDASTFGEGRRAYFERRLASLGETGPHAHTLGLVAEARGAVIGLVMGTLTHGEFGFAQPTALIDSIAVRPDQQRHQVGRQLVEAFLAEGAAQGAGEVYTLVTWNAWDLLKFFDSLGFALATTVPLRREITPAKSDERSPR
jgi:ribosomal protein S18 acetylase RimI-like enzyme